MSSRPDSPWHYAIAFYDLVRAHTKLHILIRFVGRTESSGKSESDDEVIKNQLDDIEQHLKSVRRMIGKNMMNLTQQIESELAKKDCNPGELFDATLATYPEIFAALKQLLDEGKVTHHFNNSVLTYQAVKKPLWKI